MSVALSLLLTLLPRPWTKITGKKIRNACSMLPQWSVNRGREGEKGQATKRGQAKMSKENRQLSKSSLAISPSWPSLYNQGASVAKGTV
ncbi:hypothetical protein LZ31DRAFT_251699 [Colletotrichum somersetense]|nr:hypothetical protein LZ31DRAFT_251699 [Colletotrichum somersetense]